MGFLRAARRTTQAILAIGGEQVLMNRKLRSSLDGQDLVSLTEYATDSAGRADSTFIVPLPSGRRVRLTPIPTDASDQGTVFIVQLLDEYRPVQAESLSRQNLPGLVGTSPSWRRSQQEVERCYRDGGWFLVTGEPGTGRAALLRSAAAR